MTGNLKVIKHSTLRSLLCKGPKYREPRNTNWDKIFEDIKTSVKACQLTWAAKEKCDSNVLNEWCIKVIEDVKSKIQLLKNKSSIRRRFGTILHRKDVKTYLQELHKDFVLVPTDKAGNNIAIVCKKFYIEKSMQELNIFTSHDGLASQSTYIAIDRGVKHHIKRHVHYLKKRNIMNVPEEFPFLYS